MHVLVYEPCHNVPQTGWLKEQKFIFSQFWKPDVQDKGVGSGRAGGVLVHSFLLRSLSWTCGWPCSPFIFSLDRLPSIHVCVQSSSYKDTSPIRLGFTLMTSRYLNHLCKDPISQCSRILRSWGLGHQHMAVGGTQFQTPQCTW